MSESENKETVGTREKARKTAAVLQDMLESLLAGSEEEAAAIKKRMEEEKKHIQDNLQAKVREIDDKMAVIERRLEAYETTTSVGGSDGKNKNFTYKIDGAFYPESVKLNYRINGHDFSATVQDGKLVGPHVAGNSKIKENGEVAAIFTEAPEKDTEISLSFRSKGVIDEVRKITGELELRLTTLLDKFRTDWLSKIESDIYKIKEAMQRIGKVFEEIGPAKKS